MMMWGDGFGWPMIWMVFWNLLWLALLGVLVRALVRLLTRSLTTGGDRHPSQHLSALEILRQRYARGDIDTATFEQMRERLQASTERENPSA